MVVNKIKRTETRPLLNSKMNYFSQVTEASGAVEKKCNILFISSDRKLVSGLVYSSVFKQHFTIYHICKSQENLRKLKMMAKPEIVLYDPFESDGTTDYHFFERLYQKNRYKGAYFILVTHKKVSSCEKMTGLYKGAVDFFTYPIEVDEIFNKINSLVKKQFQIREVVINDLREEMNRILNDNWQKQSGKGTESSCQTRLDEKCIKYRITDREKEVVQLLTNGLQYKEICDELNISINTLKKYVHSIYEKYHVQNHVELTNCMKYV